MKSTCFGHGYAQVGAVNEIKSWGVSTVERITRARGSHRWAPRKGKKKSSVYGLHGLLKHYESSVMELASRTPELTREFNWSFIRYHYFLIMILRHGTIYLST